ncbi:hypothetical protein [Streptomyces sp. NPDC056255]
MVRKNRVLTAAKFGDVERRYGLVTSVTGPIERTLWNLKNQR